MSAPRSFHDAVRRNIDELAARRARKDTPIDRDDVETCDIADRDDDVGDELADRDDR